MKKFFRVILAAMLVLAMLLTLTACSNAPKATPTAEPTAKPTEAPTAEPVAEVTAEPAVDATAEPVVEAAAVGDYREEETNDQESAGTRPGSSETPS